VRVAAHPKKDIAMTAPMRRRAPTRLDLLATAAAPAKETDEERDRLHAWERRLGSLQIMLDGVRASQDLKAERLLKWEKLLDMRERELAKDKPTDGDKPADPDDTDAEDDEDAENETDDTDTEEEEGAPARCPGDHRRGRALTSPDGPG
jgi:hypothetical protein